MSEDRDTIIEKVKLWIKKPNNILEQISDPGFLPGDIVYRVKGQWENYLGQKTEIQYFVALPSDMDYLQISTYFYFDKSVPLDSKSYL